MKFMPLLSAGLLLIAGAALARDPDGPSWHALRGKSLRHALANTEFDDGVHYRYSFHGDNRVEGWDMGRKIFGHWRTSADTMCWTLSDAPTKEECYEVEFSGPQMRMLHAGQEIMSGTRSTLKPTVQHGNVTDQRE